MMSFEGEILFRNNNVRDSIYDIFDIYIKI